MFVNLKDFNFGCISCGNCCYNIVVKSDYNQYINTYFYDYKGELSSNPETSVTIHYLERQKIESRLFELFKLTPKFIPFRALYLRESPIGFIYDYQLGVKKNKYCMFYNIKTRKCKIYPARPTVCKSYPLVIDPFNKKIPIILLHCSTIEKEISKHIPNIQNLDNIIFTNSQEEMESIFLEEFENFKKIVYWNSRIPVIFKVMQPLFMEINSVTPEKVKNYKLYDMSKFFNWAKINLEKTEFEKKIIEIKKKLKNLKSDLNI